MALLSGSQMLFTGPLGSVLHAGRAEQEGTFLQRSQCPRYNILYAAPSEKNIQHAISASMHSEMRCRFPGIIQIEASSPVAFSHRGLVMLQFASSE